MLRVTFLSAMCCFAGGLSAAETVIIRASQAVTPIIESAKTVVLAKHPDAVFKITPCGTKASVEAVAGGTAQLGATARPLKAEEKTANPELILTEIAKDGVALVVHASNSVADLSPKQVVDIFTGTSTNWKDVGGPDLPIAPVGRTEANAIVEFVDGVLGLEHQAVGEGKEQGMVYKIKGTPAFASLKIPLTGKHQDALALVARNPGGFTYLPLSIAREAKAKGTEIKILSFGGVETADAHILSGTYKLSRSLFLLTKGTPVGIIKELVDFILTPEGQKLVAERGGIPLK